MQKGYDIKVLTDLYEKEIKTSVKFAAKYKDRAQAAYDTLRDKVPKELEDAPRNETKALMLALSQANKNRSMNVMKKPQLNMYTLKDIRHGHSIVDLGLGDPKDDPRLDHPDDVGDPVMRPIEEKTRQILYDPYLPKIARSIYLKERAKINPENRYYFRECVSMDYGWRLMDDNPYGHHHVFSVKKEAPNRVGPQADPPYYVEPQAMAR